MDDLAEKKIDIAISNRATAVMYCISFWVGMISIYLDHKLSGFDGSGKGIASMCILVIGGSLGMMSFHMVKYISGGRVKVGFKESFKRYFEGLRTETNGLKLWAPIFIGMVAGLNIVMPLTLFIMDVLIKHREMHSQSLCLAMVVAAEFAVFYTYIASKNNKKKMNNE